MAPSKTRSLADQLADLEDPTPKDFDPEDLDDGAGSSDDEGAKESNVNGGREHYVVVGQGKLRKPDAVNLGKQYAGAQVSRDALGDDSDEDPFAARTYDEDDEDDESGSEDSDVTGSDAEGDSDNEPVTGELSSDGSESDAVSGEDSEEVDDDDDDEEEEEEEESDSDDNEEVETARHSGAGRKTAPVSEDREELRKLMASDQKTIAATISQAAKADAAKGKAVKEQRTTFDALLNTRIKLQKGLGAINELSETKSGVDAETVRDSAEDSNVEAIKSAESAALALWSTLEELRSALADAQTKDGSKKRKRAPVDATTKSTQLWERMADLESDALVSRRAILDKWSSKVRGTSTSLPNGRGKLLGSASGQQTITAVLDANVATELSDRSSKRARQNDSSNGLQSESVYDDTVFYQSLLRDLVEQRMSSSEAMTGGLDTLHQLPSRLNIHHVTGMRNDKNRRENVDTRASKGRKMRFNVHEKLQNFMAPEDRGAWSGRARDEFFASLLGKTASGLLGEGEDSGSDNESDDDLEEGGLKLFRS